MPSSPASTTSSSMLPDSNIARSFCARLAWLMSHSWDVGDAVWSVRFVSTRLRDLSTGAWSPIGADAGSVAERVARQLGAVGQPHAVRSPELVDERLQHAKPR